MSYPGKTKEIILFSPVDLGGGQLLEKVIMREPKLRDRIAFQKTPGVEDEKGAAIIADLCGIRKEEVYDMTAADYSQLEDEFNDFLLPPAMRAKPK